MRACVTGGTGFLGEALARRLLSEGLSVRVLARPSPRADELTKLGAEIVLGDLADKEAIAQAIAGAEFVYHLAANVTEGGDKRAVFETNIHGTERVLSACVQNRVRRAIYISSIAVYGLVAEGKPINEDTPFDAEPEKRDLYARSKIEADRLAMECAARTGLRLTILRPGLIYGPGRPLPIAVLGFRLGKTNVVFGRRELRVPLNYVEHLVDAMVLSAQATGEALQQYIVVDDENLTLRQYHAARTEIEKGRTLFSSGWPVLVAASLAKGVGLGESLPKQQVKRALQDRWYDTRRIREHTGWAPRVRLNEAIEQTLRGRSSAVRRGN